MKILIDQNISFRIIQHISGTFTQAEHVKSLNLTNAPDYQIFMWARLQGFLAVLTQDEDFYNLLLEHGIPPKVIWLRLGNCSTNFIAEVVLRNASLIQAFIEDDAQDCLEVYA